MVAALCRQVDPEVFFQDRGRAAGRTAVEVCWACPVLLQCRAHAARLRLAVGAERWYGTWGGYTQSAWRDRDDQIRGVLALTLRLLGAAA